MDSFEYKSVHEYLDTLFKGKAPTDTELVEAKKQYRLLYQKAYRTSYQKHNIQVSFRLSKAQYDQLDKLAKQRNIKLPSFIKSLALRPQELNTTEFKEFLLGLIDLVEEAIYEDYHLDAKDVLKQLSEMQKLLQ